MTVFPSLAFTPLKVGDITLGHRVALSPLTRMRANDAHEHQDVAVEYYSQRASYPGTLVMTEATYISARAGGVSNKPGIYTPTQIAAWKNIVDGVHAQGSYIFLQIWGLGRAAQAEQLRKEDPSFEVVSASDIPFEGGDVPRPLTREEIKEYTADFVAAAKAFIEEAGGDGVEIHSSNGYLLDQFLQTNSNKRTDSYGGSVANRSRFTLEVVDGLVAAVGERKVSIKFTPFSEYQGMKMPQADIEETFSYLVRELKARHPQLAYLSLSEPRVSANVDRATQEGESLDFIADLWSPSPIVIAGGYKAEDAEAAVRKYPNAIVAYGRYFISNPDLVARIKHGVEFTPYDRSTFYTLGPKATEGYTSYAIEYGPEGKLAL